MDHINYSVKALEELCRAAFEKFGFTAKEAAQITDVLLLADMYGIESHGTQRLARYHKNIEKGSVKVGAKPEIVFETPVSAVIDGREGMGQLVGIFATELAIKKATESGIGFVTVRNSNHFGIAGYYTKLACDKGFIGICSTNSESIMVHTGSREALLGSNPLAFAMPAEPYPFWYDAATTVVPRGKLEVYNKKEKPLAHGWATDEAGAVCTDAAHVLDCINAHNGGGILPVGGASEESGSHKGYGYAVISEIFSAILSLGATSNHHVRAPGVGAGSCHSFIVIDPGIFGDRDEIKKNLSAFLAELREAKRADDNTPIYTHGQKEFLAYEKRAKDGIDVNINTVNEIREMCDYLGLDFDKYLGSGK